MYSIKADVVFVLKFTYFAIKVASNVAELMYKSAPLVEANAGFKSVFTKGIELVKLCAEARLMAVEKELIGNLALFIISPFSVEYPAEVKELIPT